MPGPRTLPSRHSSWSAMLANATPALFCPPAHHSVTITSSIVHHLAYVKHGRWHVSSQNTAQIGSTHPIHASLQLLCAVGCWSPFTMPFPSPHRSRGGSNSACGWRGWIVRYAPPTSPLSHLMPPSKLVPNCGHSGRYTSFLTALMSGFLLLHRHLIITHLGFTKHTIYV